LAYMVLDLPIEITRRCRNMATDGFTVFANPDFVEWCSDRDVMVVLLHEAEHIGSLHHLRVPKVRGLTIEEATAKGGRWAAEAKTVFARYNVACDYSVNGGLDKAGHSLTLTWTGPGEDFTMLWHDKHSRSGAMVEKIYADILRDEPPQPEEGEGEECEEGEAVEGQPGGAKINEGGGGDERESDEGRDEEETKGEEEGAEGGDEDRTEGEEGRTNESGCVSEDHRSGGEGASEGGEGGDGQDESVCQGEGEKEDTGLDPRSPANFGGIGEIWEAPKDVDRTQAESDVLDKLAEAVLLEKAVEKAVGKGAGNHAQRLMDAYYTPDQLPFLREFLRKSVSNETTWLRQKRLHIHSGLYLPGKARGSGLVHVCVDSSGSVGKVEQKTYLGILRATCDEIDIARLKIAFVDSVIHRDADGDPWQEIDIRSGEEPYFDYRGGGGTSFNPIFREIEESGEEVEVLVYMTDGWGSVSVGDPGYPVVWLVSGKEPHGHTFGEIVDVTRFISGRW
jgi:hypothetical protein